MINSRLDARIRAPFRAVAYCPTTGALLGWAETPDRAEALRHNALSFSEVLDEIGHDPDIRIVAGPWPLVDYQRVMNEPGYILISPIAASLEHLRRAA